MQRPGIARRSLLLSGLSLFLLSSVAVAQLVQADFDTPGSYAPLQPFEPQGSGTVMRTVAGGTLQVQTTQTRALTWEPSAIHADFVIAVDVTTFDSLFVQTIGLANYAFNGTALDGYALVIDPQTSVLELRRLDNDVITVLGSTTVTPALTPTAQYRLVFKRTGPRFDGYLYDLTDMSSPISVVVNGDTSYALGSPGIDLTSDGAGADATFDNFLAGDGTHTDGDGWPDDQEIWSGTNPNDSADFPSVAISWATVGSPGNACDAQPQGCLGAVASSYRFGQYEVTNAQYAVFLNAVASSDPNGIYNVSMVSGFGGILRAGRSPNWSYATRAGRADMPVGWVSWYDALRFANWLHNGQPAGVQDATTTEDGAYTFTGTTSVGARNAGAQAFLPSEDEWFKAAYYDPSGSSYFAFPAGSDTQPACSAPTFTANSANCQVAAGDFTTFGSYSGSASPNGTFDQGGNVWEWTEVVSGSLRVTRGGGYDSVPGVLSASSQGGIDPASEYDDVGFRVASPVPPMAVPAFGPMGLTLLAGALTLAAARRLRK